MKVNLAQALQGRREVCQDQKAVATLVFFRATVAFNGKPLCDLSDLDEDAERGGCSADGLSNPGKSCFNVEAHLSTVQLSPERGGGSEEANESLP